MNDRLFRTILKRYEAAIEDANYKIDIICEQNLVVRNEEILWPKQGRKNSIIGQ